MNVIRVSETKNVSVSDVQEGVKNEVKKAHEGKKKITVMGRGKTVEEAIELFLRKCKIKNLSEVTIRDYRDHLAVFQDFCGNNVERVSEISEATVDDFICWLQNERQTASTVKISAISINTLLRSLRAFLYYCMDNNFLSRFKVKLIKAEKKVKETYSDEELELLLQKPDIDTCSFPVYRTWVFENYLLGTGNRLSTALNVRNCDIDFTNATILLQKTKNRCQQIIPLSNSLAVILEEYMEIRGGEDEDFLFCDQYGNQGTGTAFRSAVYDYNKARGVQKTSIHVFRHTFAKKWILAGGDVFRLQKILGHSSLTVTKEYITMFGQDLQMDFEKFNPLDRMMREKKKETKLYM